MDNEIVSREAWFAARQQFLLKEKAHTRARAELSQQRQALPWRLLDKNYNFVGTEGDINLLDLFADSSQLIVYHLMFGPDWETPCVGCTSWANAFNSTTQQFARADARLIAVSRAPQKMLAAQSALQNWDFTWVSSLGSEFNYDFYASSEDQSPSSSKIVGGRDGEDGELVEFDRGENHGVSVFAKNAAGEIFHTYSTYNRGIEALNGAFGYFDLLPKGRAW